MTVLTVVLAIADYLWRHIAVLLTIGVLYLWHRIDRIESRPSYDEHDFAWRLERLASEIPDDEWEETLVRDEEP